MTITQYNYNKSLASEFKWASCNTKKLFGWLNSITYQSRLEKALWFQFRLGSKIWTSGQAQSGIRTKIHNPRSAVFSKSANPLDLPQKSTIHALLKAKSIDPKTYSPPPKTTLYLLSYFSAQYPKRQHKSCRCGPFEAGNSKGCQTAF